MLIAFTRHARNCMAVTMIPEMLFMRLPIASAQHAQKCTRFATTPLRLPLTIDTL